MPQGISSLGLQEELLQGHTAWPDQQRRSSTHLRESAAVPGASQDLGVLASQLLDMALKHVQQPKDALEPRLAQQ